MTVDEAPAVFADTNEQIGYYSVGFVKIQGEEEDALPSGSGTLVTSGGRYAILTADHVLEALPARGDFGLVFPTLQERARIHRYRLDFERATRIRVAKASRDQNGPDLALLVLGSPDIENLEASKSFYNLDKRRECMCSSPPAIDLGGWFLFGMAAERTSDLKPERGFTRVKEFRGICGAGVVTSEHHRCGYDYLNYEAKYDGRYEGPVSFEGFSGGGLWQIRLIERDGKIEISDILLSGVAFYQSDIVDNMRTIHCHGRRSIYDKVCNAMAGQLAS